MKRCFLFVLLCLLCHTSVLFAQAETLPLQRLLSKDVLAQTQKIRCMLQDFRGFLWIGTDKGLYRYDGYRLRLYQHDPDNQQSLRHNEILTLFEDRTGILWIGTRDGLHRFNRKNEQFFSYRSNPNEPTSLSHNSVTSVHEDRAGRLWIGTDGGGLNRLDRKSGQFVRYQIQADKPGSISSNFIRTLHEDRTGTLWIGTLSGGLNRFDAETGTFTSYQPDAKEQESLSHRIVTTIHEDRWGKLWIGTDGGGLNSFDRKTGRFYTYDSDSQVPGSLSHCRVSAIHEDRQGNLWIGTYGGGLNRFDRHTDKFEHYRVDAENPHSLSHNMVTTLYEDRSGVLWIGTDGGGLNKLVCNAGQFPSYQLPPHNATSLVNNVVLAIQEDRAGMIWIGTYGAGLAKYDREHERVTFYMHDPAQPSSLSSNTVLALCEDRLGNLWIGTEDGGLNRFIPRSSREEDEHFVHYQSEVGRPDSLSHDTIRVIFEDHLGTLWIGTEGGGLNSFDRGHNRFVRYRNDPKSPDALHDSAVWALAEDREGTLWVGTDNGLKRFDRQSGRFIRDAVKDSPDNALNNLHVRSIHEDSEGNLWIGTRGGGLFRLNQKQGTVRQYDEEIGLPGKTIYGILQDEQGRLWLSTNQQGLTRFNPWTNLCEQFTVDDGLPSNVFNAEAYYQSRSGEMFFGGIYGLTIFSPQHIRQKSAQLPIVLTDFRLFGKSVKPGDYAGLTSSITESESITLSHQDNTFAFEFALLEYVSPEQHQYAYKLEGFDKDWISSGTIRTARYSNVPAGTYKLKIKGANSKGVWNECGTSISLIVTPPWWKTVWFQACMAFFVIGLTAGGYSWRVQAITRRNRELQTQVAERTKQLAESNIQLTLAKEAAEAANHTKSEFLANMSHELRTPLNAILGFAQVMDRSRTLPTEHQENLAIIHRNGEHLLTLINQVLDLSKIEAGRTTLNEKAFDLNRLLLDIEDTFSLKVKEKGLRLLINCVEGAPQSIRTDEVKLRQILFNLVNNAVKFTSAGTISLEVNELGKGGNYSPSQISSSLTRKARNSGTQRLLFEVADTGSGISEEELPKLFEAFSQTESGRHAQEGTGLGLTISRQFAQLMGGDISVKSAVGRGTTFFVTIQVEVVEPTNQISSAASRLKQAIALETGQPRYRLLIVDDKKDNRRLLVKLLAPFGFDLREAANGKEAMTIWHEWQPHLIWMDLRMPDITGYEVTRQIRAAKAGETTKIIALSASSLEDEREVAITNGCDDFLRKPFRSAELFNLIQTHLGLRFMYETFTPQSEEDASQTYPENSLRVDLRNLPANILAELEHAAITTNFSYISRRIDEIRPEHPRLAQALSRLNDRFDYSGILSLLQR